MKKPIIKMCSFSHKYECVEWYDIPGSAIHLAGHGNTPMDAYKDFEAKKAVFMMENAPRIQGGNFIPPRPFFGTNHDHLMTGMPRRWQEEPVIFFPV